MNQPTLFDDLYREPLVSPPAAALAPGEVLKRQGMERARDAKADAVGYARELAVDIARGVLRKANGEYVADGLCNADDVAAQLEREGKPSLGNAAGVLFQDGNWVFVEFIKSVRPHAHANLLRQWRRK
jgi:hypothetical protein